MGQPRAQSKREKCKYKRCMSKRFYPEEKPIYCGKHRDKLENKDQNSIFNASSFKTNNIIVGNTYSSFLTKIKNFIFVQK